MADVKISALPAVPVAVATTDLFAIVQGGVTYKATLTQVVAAITSTGLTATAGLLTANLSTGVAGGQSVIGGTAASNSLTLSSTSNATKGKILFGTSAYDEANNRLGIGTQSPNYPIEAITNTNTTSNIFVLQNQNNGSSANAGYFIANDLGASGACLVQVLSSTFTPSGTGLANSARIRTGTGLTNGISIGTGTTAPIVLYTNDTERARIFGSGNVFIGASPSDAGFRLDVNGTARIQERLTVSQDNTVATEVVSVITTDTANCGMVIAPTGVGAIMASIPDGTATGGNNRGNNAVDLQMTRTAATQIASGSNSFIGGGTRNSASGVFAAVICGEASTATGDWSIAGGGACSSSGPSSVSFGDNSSASANSSFAIGMRASAYLYGQQSRGAGRFSTNGDAQTSSITYRQSITGKAATELFLDGASIRAVLPSNKAWRAQVDVVAIVQTVGNGTVTLGDCFMGSYHVGIKRIGANTSLVGAVDIANEVNDAGMAGAAVTITADDTNEALKIEFTPATNAGSTTVTRVVATAYLTEVGY